MFIYVIVNSVTMRLYIGQHKGTNLQKYLQTKFSDAKHFRGGQSHLYVSMRKDSQEVWSIHPLLEVQTKVELDYWEKFYIKLFHAQDSAHGYNICRGGEGFTGPHSEATKQRERETHLGNTNCLGNKQSPETIAKRIAKTRGQTRTLAQRANISAGINPANRIGSTNAAGKRTGQALENIREATKRYWESKTVL